MKKRTLLETDTHISFDMMPANKKQENDLACRKVAPRTANPYPAKNFFSSLTIVSSPPTGTPAAGPIQHDAQSFLQARSSQDASKRVGKEGPSTGRWVVRALPSPTRFRLLSLAFLFEV
ncbi:uncharacterized protein CLUP02_11363 [Colletotrichum lupini]|uniref:Uncharacterized protein n=1 Tax=Colletotrichum lupini TaxID=145971 RepID=A0A9Q8SYG8_9PEZI|nr:uncharacterized protein CLUP02_11363 [Colletotrichum lupini]UQC85864.1 hypothetical protein CLUP02_11363 [Colletotrichum lupini]